MIVEDEPPMIRHIKRIIDKSASGFEVVAEAYNGEEALEKIALIRPDVVITDIKMPVMNGLDLSRSLKERYPQIITIIVSGYQDFDYAKEALKYGVADYLLKPIEPALLCQLLEILSKKLDDRYLSVCTNSLKRIVRSLSVEEDILSQHLNYKQFSAVSIRIGTLSSRFGSKLLPSYDSPFKSLDPSYQLSRQIHLDVCWQIEGRDENEMLVIFPLSGQPCITAKTVSDRIYPLLKNHQNFITIVFSHDFFELGCLNARIHRLNVVMDHNLVIGKDQILDSDMEDSSGKFSPPILNSNLETKLNILIQEKSLNLLKDELTKLFQYWEAQSFPQIWIEKMLKQIMRLVEKNSPYLSAGISMNIDQQLEEIFSLSNNFTELLQEVWNIAEDLLSDNQGMEAARNTVQSLLGMIDTYINTHIAEPVTLQSICDTFEVSQPYLSRLFRKHKNMSFNEYVTNLRVNEAKRLMREHPDMLFKNIAEIVGYQDQHYFSRIFRTMTGLAPSKFKEQNLAV